MSTNNLWVLAIFFAMSFGSWLLNQLREQAKLKKARDEARRQYEEHLRTGRAEPARAPTVEARAATPTDDEQAQRRQAQLRELRNKQTSGGRTVVIARPVPAPTQRPAPAPIVLGPGGIVIPRGPGMQRPRTTAAERRESAEAVAAAQAAEAAREALEQRRARERAQREAAMQAAERAEAAARAKAVPASVRSLLVGNDGRMVRGDQLRRLVALKEILDPPLALRASGPG